MHRTATLLATTALALAACSGARAPDDAQLALLLQPEGARAGADHHLVGCMRGLSGDVELLRGLAVRFAGEDGQQRCRVHLEERLADATRNPERFNLAELTAPATVRRAMGLLESRQMTRSPSMKGQPVVGLAPPDPNIDLGAAGVRLAEAEGLCRRVLETGGDSPERQRFGQSCSRRLNHLRRNMETNVGRGFGTERLERFAQAADRIAATARKLLGESGD